MSTYSPGQAPEPEIGEEPCPYCGGECGSYDECEEYASDNMRDEMALVAAGKAGTGEDWYFAENDEGE